MTGSGLMPLGLMEEILSIVTGIFLTLIGIIYRRLKRRISELEDEVSNLHERHLEMSRSIDTAYAWMFGREEDETSHGVASKIEEGFEDSEARRQEINDRLDALIDALHDEELEFERDDIPDDD